MPYTEASLRELLRTESVIPSGFPHLALNATRISGYDVAKVSVRVKPEGSELVKILISTNREPLW